MTWWQYLLLVNIYLVLFYGFYVLLLRSETFFKLNRIYLVASALLSFLIPVIHSDWVQNLFITQKVEDTLMVYSAPIMVYHFKPIEENHITIGELIVLIYITGAIVLTARFMWQLISLKKIINQPEATGAFSFFNSIRLNEEAARNEIITAHEKVHARELHSADIMLIEAISIINWFNPVVYLYRLAIKHIHEFIADSQAVESGTTKAEYALLLLSQTLAAPAHQLVNPFFNHSLLKRRIIMLQKNRSQRMALLKYGLSAPLFILMLILSSATIGKSRTVNLLNKKAEVVFLTPAQALDSSVKDTSAMEEMETAASPAIPIAQQNKDNEQITVIPADTTVKSGPIFTAVEKNPQFVGGITAFYRFLTSNIRYPEAMRKNNIQGKVFLTFVIERDGSLSDIKSLRDVGYGSGEEAIRVLSISPKWEPGIQNGRAVRVQYTVPISFALDKGNPVKDTTMKSGDVPDKGNKANNLTLNKAPKDTSYTLVLKGPNANYNLLYILDGKEIASLNNINPNDIESISVLKNDRTNLVGLYGPKAENGVVLIKTKAAAAKKQPAKN